MDLLTTLRSFIRVSETGSFSAVAAERGMTQPAISRQITALEEHLGIRLVHRSTQVVNLTDEGRNLLPAALDMVSAADAMLEGARHRRAKPVGHVRIAVSVPLGLYLGTHIAKLLDQHPELSVELVLRDCYGNLIEEGLDAEIRVGERSDSSLISRRVGSTGQLLVAGPGYLKDRPEMHHPRDLAGHLCIVHHREGRNNVWRFNHLAGTDEISVNVQGRFSSNNAAAIHRAALGGHGVACLPHLMVRSDVKAGRLRRLLPEYRLRRDPIYIDYPSRRGLPPRVKAVIDFLHGIARADPLLLP